MSYGIKDTAEMAWVGFCLGVGLALGLLAVLALAVAAC